MRYDIYSAITYELSDYKLGTKAGEIVKGIFPSKLEKKVDEIDRNYIEFDLDLNKVEAIANSNDDLEDSEYRDVIDFSVSLLEPIENIMDASSEEVVGYNKATDNLHYSCLEIIKDKDNTLFVVGSVAFQVTGNKLLLLEAKLGKYIYENEYIENCSQLKELTTSKQYSGDIYEKLQKIKKRLWKDEFIIPENFVTITIGKALAEDTIILNNDGVIEPIKAYSKAYQENFGGKIYSNYKSILKGLDNISDCLFLQEFDKDLYGKFNSLEFIEYFTNKAKTEKPKQFQKKATKIMPSE